MTRDKTTGQQTYSESDLDIRGIITKAEKLRRKGMDLGFVVFYFVRSFFAVPKLSLCSGNLDLFLNSVV